MGSYMKMHMKAHKAQVKVEGLVFVLKTKKCSSLLQNKLECCFKEFFFQTYLMLDSKAGACAKAWSSKKTGDNL
jgi:hypothetical protein